MFLPLPELLPFRGVETIDLPVDSRSFSFSFDDEIKTATPIKTSSSIGSKPATIAKGKNMSGGFASFLGGLGGGGLSLDPDLSGGDAAPSAANSGFGDVGATFGDVNIKSGGFKPLTVALLVIGAIVIAGINGRSKRKK